MKAIDPTALADMTISMLERTAMILAEPAEAGQEHPPATHFARIGYGGPSRGSVLLGATDGFLRELAASLLGVESDDVDVDTHGADALCEMANIVGGSTILALSGETCQYSLGLPAVVKPADAALDGRGRRAECIIVAEGGPLYVLWQDEEIAQAA